MGQVASTYFAVAEAKEAPRFVERDSEVEGLYNALSDRAKDDYLAALEQVQRDGRSGGPDDVMLSYT